jgi:hypothetical protein
VRCLASAGGDCAAVDECLGLLTTTATCDSMEESCDGDRAIHCGPDGTTVEDCPNSIWNAPAPTCIVDGDGHSRCGAQGICTEIADSCVGDFLLRCEDVASTGMWTASGDCARSGWTCAQVSERFARCSDGTSELCMLETYTGECDGDVVTICPGEFLISTECTRIPGGYCNVGDPRCRVADECDTSDATCADSRTCSSARSAPPAQSTAWRSASPAASTRSSDQGRADSTDPTAATSCRPSGSALRGPGPGSGRGRLR